MTKSLIIYDGNCGLCNRLVGWILKRDAKKRCLITSFESKTAQMLLPQLPEEWRKGDALILLENYGPSFEGSYTGGAAVVRILVHLDSGWKILGAFLGLLPSCVLERCYQAVAGRRRRICPASKKVETNPIWNERFLK